MLIVLDRDGVINQDSDDYIKNPDEWIPIDGSLEAIATLKQAGHTVVVATNQSGVGRGYYSDDTLQAIHQKMHDALARHNTHVDGVYYCPHKPDDGCDCRKPKPGLLEQIQNDHQNVWAESIFVGDNISDMLVAKAVDCPTILVRTGKGLKTERQVDTKTLLAVADTLAAAVALPVFNGPI